MLFLSTIASVLLGLASPQDSSQDKKTNDVPDARIPLSDKPIGPLSFSKDGKYLAVMLDQKADVALIDFQARKVIRTLSGLKRPPGPPEFAQPRLAFSPDSKVLVGRLQMMLDRREGGSLPVWDLETGKVIARLSAFDYQTYSIEFSSDGNTFLASSTNIGTGYDRKTGVRVWEWPLKGKHFPSAASRSLDVPSSWSNVLFAPGDKTMISMIEEERFEIRDLQTGKLLEEVKTYVDKDSGPEKWSAFSPDGKLMAVAAARGGVVPAGQPMPGVLKIWDFEKKSLRHTLPQPDLSLHVSFSPDGKRVAVTSQGPTPERNLVNIYDVESGHLDRTLRGDFYHAAFSPDGQWLADVGQTDILLWKMR